MPRIKQEKPRRAVATRYPRAAGGSPSTYRSTSSVSRQPRRVGTVSVSRPVSDCPICLESGADFTTRCGHSFHPECIAGILVEGVPPKCPMCRASIINDMVDDSRVVRAYFARRQDDEDFDDYGNFRN